MKTLQLKTNLRCNACVQAIQPLLDSEPTIQHWSANMADPDKVLTVQGNDITLARVDELLRQKGYQILGEKAALPALSMVNDTSKPIAATEEAKQSYYPLVLILVYILLVCFLVEWSHGSFNWMRAMNHFMAGFFLVFSFFKLLNLSAFVDAFAGYDLLAARSRMYGYSYPFIELLLGMAFLTGFQPFFANMFTLIVMGISTVGVVQSLLQRRKIRCACLGSIFNLPMSYVTLTEDLLMVGMAAIMLVMI